MANLTELLTGGSAVGAPDAGATLIDRVYSSRGTYDYIPNSPLAAGKYSVKCSTGSRGTLRVGAAGVGVDVRGNDNQAVIDIPSTASSINVSFENFDVEPVFQSRVLPRYVPGLNGTTNYTTYANSRMIASDPTGKTQVQVTGQSGGGIFTSKDFGRTWHSVGTFINLVPGQTNSNDDSYSVQYFRDRFIIAGGPATAQSYAIFSLDGFDWQYVGDSNLTNIRVAELNTTSLNPSAATVYVAGKHAATSNLVYSVDGINFITAANPSGWSGNVVGIYWDGTQFIAWNDAATQQTTTSTDGITWTAAVSQTIIIRSLVKIGATYYAITTNGIVYSSTNLTTWTNLATISTSTNPNHRFVLVGSTIVYYDPNNGQIRTSTDGTNWTTRVTGLNQYGTVNFDALGRGWYTQSSNVQFYTIDLNSPTSWNAIINLNTNSNLVSVYGNSTWVIGKASGGLISSTDGFTWVDRSALVGGAIAQNFTNGIYANGRFMLVGNQGSVVTSTDGATFTRLHTAGSANGPANANTRGLAYGGTSPVWVIGNASGQVYTSADNGSTWTLRQTLATAVNDIAWNGTDLFVAACSSGNIYTSPDGVTWTLRTGTAGGTSVGQTGQNLAGITLNGVAYGNGIWLVLGNSGESITSTDGLEWRTNVKNSSWYQASSFQKVRFINGAFRIVGTNGYYANSTDGINFYQTHSGHATTTVNDVAWDGSSRWMLAGNSGQITLSSDNTATYFSTYSISGQVPSTQYSAVFFNNKYTLFNANGIWRTSDFLEFDPYVSNAIQQGSNLTEAVSGNGVIVARGTSLITYWSPDGLRWVPCKKAARNDEQRANQLFYEDGKFVKYYNATKTISTSPDGQTWTDFYTFSRSHFTTNVSPTNIKKVNGTWVCWNNGNSYYGHNRELWLYPRNWTNISLPTSPVYDIDGVDDWYAISVASAYLFVSTSINFVSGNNATGFSSGTAGTTGLCKLEEGYGEQIFTPANVFAIANKLYATNTSGVVYEIVRIPDAKPQSNTVGNGPVLTLANARQNGISLTTSPNGFSYSDYGRFIRNNNIVWSPSSSTGQMFELSASSPSVISIYNSTVSTVN